MAIQEYYFRGSIQWAHSLFQKGKYDDYRLKFYPADSNVRKGIRDTGTQAKVKEDDNGFFYTFKNTIQPPVTDEAGQPVEAKMGNGTEVNIKVSVEKFTSPTYGEVARTKLLGVVVTKLVEYVPPKTDEPKSDPVSEVLPS